ncbi:hypothetical protein [Gemmatimonas sp. UBA7669]|uniref:hypothetical protein n=1 Tax=Gemmatimonas sp. UBA7669 TaxID=1946568 RepID=UPI0025BA6398|nr:hypothetical protein [Gemmatimonas sp. UBA7669]
MTAHTPSASRDVRPSFPPIARLGLMLVVGGTMAVALAYALAFAAAPWPARSAWLMAAAQPAIMVGAMALSTRGRSARDRRWVLTLVVVALSVLSGLLAVLLMPAEQATTPLWLGLPPRVLVLLVLVVAVPSVALPWVYAKTFVAVADGE